MKKGRIKKLRCPECRRKVKRKGLCDSCRKALHPRSKRKGAKA